ncbi:MAG: hypothetical protein ACLPX9_01615 [Rhodomicrobium sp.]
MSEKSVISTEPGHGSYAGRLSLFDQIAQGFLNALVNHLASGEALACLDYLDGKVKIDDASCTRRLVVFAIEDLKQQIEAPLLLCSAAYALMKLLKLDPTRELKQYRDLATAILRIDAALHLTRISKTAWQRIYH